jgi:hypothetical protein
MVSVTPYDAKVAGLISAWGIDIQKIDYTGRSMGAVHPQRSLMVDLVCTKLHGVIGT